MPARPRRRAVGPPGVPPVRDEPRESEPDARAGEERREDDDERLRADRPPHHDRGV